MVAVLVALDETLTTHLEGIMPYCELSETVDRARKWMGDLASKMSSEDDVGRQQALRGEMAVAQTFYLRMSDMLVAARRGCSPS